MSLAAAFVTALGASGGKTTWVLEIEGIPYAFGTKAATGAAWWGGSPVTFEGLLASIARDESGRPAIDFGDQVLNHADGRTEISECSITLHDTDDTLHGYCASARADGRVRLLSGISATGLNATAVDDAVKLAAFGASGTCWFGREACDFARSGTTLTLSNRGRYRSTARAYLGHDDQGHQGQPISAYPRGLTGRRCWLKLALGAPEASSNSDMTQVFAGVIDGIEWQEQRLLKLKLHDGQALARRPIFNRAARYLGDSPIQSDGTLYTRGEDAANGTEMIVQDGGRGIVRYTRDTSLVDDRGDAWTWTASVVGLSVARLDALFAANPTGVRPAVLIAKDEAPWSGSGFGTSNHPLDLALRVLMGGGGDATYGIFDGGGCELTSTDVDVTGFLTLRNATAWMHTVAWVETEAVSDGRAWVAEKLLRPFGFFLRTTIDGKVGVGQLAVPATQWDRDQAAALSQNDLARDATARPVSLDGPHAEAAQVFRGVRYTLEDGAEKTIILSEDMGGDEAAAADGAVMDLSTPGLVGDDPAVQTSARANALRMLALIAERYATAPQRYKLTFPLHKAVRANGTGVEVGDLVAVTLPDVANPYGASRGLVGTILEVWGRRIDWMTWTVEFDLAATFAQQRNSRFLAPAAIINAFGWNDGAKTATVIQHSFTDSTGDYDDTDAFAVGDVVRIYAADMGSRSATTIITAITATTIVVDKDAAALGVTPAVGYAILLADYDEVSTAAKARWAFTADEDLTLGAGAAAAHEHQ